MYFTFVQYGCAAAEKESKEKHVELQICVAFYFCKIHYRNCALVDQQSGNSNVTFSFCHRYSNFYLSSNCKYICHLQ